MLDALTANTENLFLSIHIHGNFTFTHLFRAGDTSNPAHTSITHMMRYFSFMISIIHFIFIFSSSIPLNFVFFLLQFYALCIRCNISISQCARIVAQPIRRQTASWISREELLASVRPTYYISIFSQTPKKRRS